MHTPHDLPVPSWLQSSEPPVSLAAEPVLEPEPFAPAAITNFLGLLDNNSVIPPDTHGAVGTNRVMVALNSQVRIQNRDGSVVSTVSLNSFWSSVGGGSGAFDPKVLYDPYNHRWIFTACDDSRSASSGILIGVSQTADPSGVWNLYKIDADPANILWADYPSIGFNKNWIVVQVNMFPISSGSFQSNIYAFNKADLYAGGTGLYTLFTNSSIGGTQVAAITYDNSLSTMYLITDWNGNSGGSGYLRLFTITGAVGSETFTVGSYISTPNPWDDGPPSGNDFAPQLGSAQKIQNNDSRIQNLIYRNGSLWCTHTVFLPAGGAATRSAVQWWQLSTTGTIQQRARIEDPTGTQFYAFPSIAVNKTNDVMIGYSRYSTNQYASGNYSFRLGTDPVNTMQADTVLKAGETPYYKIYSGTRNRWGDYSSTMVDPVNDTDMWTIQEYAASPANTWGTWWGQVGFSTAPPGANFTGTPTNGVAPLTVTFTDTSTGTITNRFWDFGNSVTSNTIATTVQYTYNAVGTNTVTLTVSGPGGTNTFSRPAYIVVTPPQLPNAPSNLIVTNIFEDQAWLSWQDNSNNETGFAVERGPSMSGPWSQVRAVPQNITNALDCTLAGGTTYYYRVSATNSFGVSLPSNVANLSTPVTANFAAFDRASESAYVSNWSSGQNGGFGFGPWQLATSTGSSGQNGFFIGSSTNNGTPGGVSIDSCGKAFGLYANSGKSAVAFRTFGGSPIAGGQTFRWRMDNGFISSSASVGITLRTGNATGSVNDYNTNSRFEFYFVGGNTNYTVFDANGVRDTGVPFSSEALDLQFTLTGADTYSLQISRLATGLTTNLTGSLAGTGGAALDSFALYNRFAGSGAAYDAFFNYFQLSAVPCSYSINPNTVTFASFGGITNIDVTASAVNCPWVAGSTDTWITVAAAGVTNFGNGTVTYTVDANTTSNIRTGTVGVAGLTHTVINLGATADLAILKSASNPTITLGQPVSYSITVSNLGPSAVSSVTITDALPTGVDFVSVTPTQGTCTNIAGVVSCDLGPLASNATASVSIAATASMIGVINNTATVVHELSDPDLLNNSATTVITVPVDADGDGMADDWELAHGLDPTNAGDAALDLDGDGFTNLQEFLAGTEPFDGNSALHIVSIAEETSDLRITWLTGVGKTNALQFTNGEAGSGVYTNDFTDLFLVTNTTGSVTNYLDIGGATNFPARYYRVRLVP